MTNAPSNLIEHLRCNQPATWSLLKLASAQGLAWINDNEDALLVSKDLPQKHPRLHFVLQRLISEGDYPAIDSKQGR